MGFLRNMRERRQENKALRKSKNMRESYLKDKGIETDQMKADRINKVSKQQNRRDFRTAVTGSPTFRDYVNNRTKIGGFAAMRKKRKRRGKNTAPDYAPYEQPTVDRNSGMGMADRP